MKYFKTRQRNLFDQLPFKVILTVPANWDHAAQNRTRQAVVKAGILKNQFGRVWLQRTELDIVSEPEASALAAFNDVRRGLNLKVQKNMILELTFSLIANRRKILSLFVTQVEEQ
jgi:molecular chaperone DnaK (HSP70)